ncbi:MAG TPA: nitrate reductase [Gemmataceae bacterium]|nr:nitrate reductase [Gemmataceae bacterium]
MDHTESICPYCGVGCRLQIDGNLANGLHVRGVADAPANHGRICAKGVLLGQTIQTRDRLLRPMIRSDRRQRLHQADWSTALDYAAGAFRRIIRQHGPDAVAFYGSGQLDSEAAYLAVKLFKGTLHTNNTDSNSRLCMASAVAGYRSSLGSDGPPTCYEDVDHADVILFIGSNAAEAHPVLFDRVRAAKKVRPGLFIITVDPRLTHTARDSDLHLAVTPGGDIALLNALARMMLDLGYVDHEFINAHTNGFNEYRDFLRAGDLQEWSAACGIQLDLLRAVARRLGQAKALLSMYCMGLGQSTVGTWKNNSIINLHLLSGQIGKVGAGPFSLTGQPNAMGGREVGLLSHQLPGYRFVDNPEHRRELEAAWNQPRGSIQSAPGLSAVEMFRALERGKLKAIWIAATNPMVSLPDLHQIRRALQRAELVVVSDAYHPTETTQFAHVLFPAAQWGEKEWTSTSSERLVSHSPKVFDPPGEAKPDWQIIAEFAKALQLPGFDYCDASEVWDEFRKLTAGRPCEMAGISAQRLRCEKHVYWPCPRENEPGAQRRYLDRVFPTPDGKARFLPRPHALPRESSDHEFPFVLTTGRLYGHWHTLTRTGKCTKLVKRDPEPYAEIHPEDAARLDIQDGEFIQLSSRRGTIQLPARVSTAVTPGLVFLPFHWGDLYAPDNAVNYLTIAALDSTSKQPELKFCAIAVEKIAPAPREYVPTPAKFVDRSLSLPVLT